MKGAILSLPDRGEPSVLSPEPYDSEDTLQRLLEDHPSLLAGDQLSPDAPLRWLLVRREMKIGEDPDGPGRWSIDHLFLDQDGVPTLVEVKRSTDTRIRREVVGQMLDYAANGVIYWPVETIRTAFEATCSDRGDSPSSVLSRVLDDESDEDEFWTQVSTNLTAGRVRLVFVADEIPQTLLRVIQFLDEQMSPASVHAIEVRQFVGSGTRTLVPRVVGQSALRRRGTKKTEPAPEWTEQRFFSALKEVRPELLPVAQSFLDWGKRGRRSVRWGSGSRAGSFHIFAESLEDVRQTLVTISTTGLGRVRFERLLKEAPFESSASREELLHMLNEIPGVQLDNSTGKPAFDLSALIQSSPREAFMDVLEWVQAAIERGGVERDTVELP